MAKRYPSISEAHQQFIERQKLFFVATSMPGGRLNLSPKGMDTLRVTGPNRVVWLNLTGSGNETAAHLRHDPRITLMFCALDGAP
ncbi:MAG: pyridoxamine 5'-phosphate oxidase family protein, partial [Sedimenticola sp.]